MSNYSELLKDPRWQKRRLEMFQRDDWTCQFCFKKDKTLHVHHIEYISGKYPWEYSDEFLVTLCHQCHDFEERLRRDNPNFTAVAKASKMLAVKLYVMSASMAFLKNNHPKQYEEIDAIIGRVVGRDDNDGFKRFIETLLV